MSKLTVEANLPLTPVVADFNRDGWDDIAFANNRQGRADILINKGDGSFANVNAFTLGTSSAGSLVVGDFNGDGLHDLASRAASSSKVSWIPGRGDGTFGAPLVMNAPTNPQYIAVGDLDGDGRPDLVVASFASGTTRWSMFWGAPGGGFEPFIPFYSEPSGSFPGPPAVGDVTGDGIDDVAFMLNGDKRTVVLRGSPSREFAEISLFNAYGQPHLMDLDTDGDLDLMLEDRYRGPVGFFPMYNDGVGTFTASSGVPVLEYRSLRASFGSSNPVGADFDADGDMDLAVIEFEQDGRIWGAGVLVNDNGFGFSSEFADLFPRLQFKSLRAVAYPDPYIRFGDPALSYRSHAIADFNRDGLPDIVHVAGSANSFSWTDPGAVYVLLNTDDWKHRENASVPVAANHTLADVDGDGLAEILVSTSTAGIQIYKYNGMERPTLMTTIPDVEASSYDIGITDFNGDGLPDLYPRTLWGAASVGTAWINGGDGTSWQPVNHGALAGSFADVADLDGDGLADYWRGITWRRGLGDGTFEPDQRILPSGVSYNSIRLAELNGDGRLDFLYSDSNGRLVMVFRTDIGWSEPVLVSAPRIPDDRRRMGLVDLNNDGLDDLITEGVIVGQPIARSVYLNLGGRFATTPTYSESGYGGVSKPPGVRFDYNLDGLEDVMVYLNTNVPTSIDGDMLISRGDGTVAKSEYIGLWPSNLADVNGDGIDDVIVHGRVLAFGSNYDAVPPVHHKANFSVEKSQRLSVGFLERISPAVDATLIRATHRGTGVVYQPDVAHRSPDLRSVIAEFNLPAGDYDFDLLPGAVHDLAGKPNPRQARLLVEDTFILAGDANRDRRVDFADLLIVAQNYGQSGKTFSQGNFDYSLDGLVDFGDLLIVAQQYGTTILSTARPAAPMRADRIANDVFSASTAVV